MRQSGPSSDADDAPSGLLMHRFVHWKGPPQNKTDHATILLKGLSIVELILTLVTRTWTTAAGVIKTPATTSSLSRSTYPSARMVEMANPRVSIRISTDQPRCGRPITKQNNFALMHNLFSYQALSSPISSSVFLVCLGTSRVKLITPCLALISAAFGHILFVLSSPRYSDIVSMLNSSLIVYLALP